MGSTKQSIWQPPVKCVALATAAGQHYFQVYEFSTQNEGQVALQHVDCQQFGDGARVASWAKMCLRLALARLRSGVCPAAVEHTYIARQAPRHAREGQPPIRANTHAKEKHSREGLGRMPAGTTSVHQAQNRFATIITAFLLGPRGEGGRAGALTRASWGAHRWSAARETRAAAKAGSPMGSTGPLSEWSSRQWGPCKSQHWPVESRRSVTLNKRVNGSMCVHRALFRKTTITEKRRVATACGCARRPRVCTCHEGRLPEHLKKGGTQVHEEPRHLRQLCTQ